MATVQARAHVDVLHPSPVELPIVVSKVHSEAALNTGKHAHELKTKNEYCWRLAPTIPGVQKPRKIEKNVGGTTRYCSNNSLGGFFHKWQSMCRDDGTFQ